MTSSFLRFFLAVGLLLSGLVGGPAADAAQPNILLIVADDLGWNDVGWHGGPFKTPNLDQLAREGVELDQHYVQPLCTPTRTALLSGRVPSRFGPHALSPSNLRAMPLGTVTLASALQSVGYATFQAGKWHLGARPEWGPNHYGFQHSYGFLTGAIDPWTHKYRQGTYEDTWHRDCKLFHEEGNATELIAAQAVKWIGQQREPWFLYLPFGAVHTPVDAPDEFKRLYDGVKFDDDPALHDSRLRLGAFVSQLDDKVGDCLAALKGTGQRDNTLIIFTSDNGGLTKAGNPYVGKTPPSPKNSDNTPLRGQKGELYEGGIRVCAFASWPGKLAARKVATPMHAVDWFPTVAEVVGYKPAADLKWDGESAWSALTGGQRSGPRTIYIPFTKGDVLRHGDWKLLAFKTGDPQLFNLARDPYEKTDLASTEPARLAELTALLAKARQGDVTKLPEDLVGVEK